MDGTTRDILLPWSPQHPGGGAKPGMPAKHSELWGFSSSKFRKRKTWQRDNDDEQEETIMISVGQLLCGRPVLCTVHPYKHYCGSYFCYHYKNKARRESHSQQWFQLPFVSCTLRQCGWVGKPLPPHTVGPCISGNGAEIPGRRGRGLDYQGRQTHTPALPAPCPRSSEDQGLQF